MNPGTIYEVTIDMWSTCYAFNKGHRIRVDISSSNYPRFSANPNNGLLLNQNGPLIYAGNTVYFDKQHQSRITLPLSVN